MRTYHSESGFTIVELIVASMITLAVIGIALTTFSNAMSTERGDDAGRRLEPEPAGRHEPAGARSAAGGPQHPDRRHLHSVRSRFGRYLPAQSADDQSITFDNTTQTALSAITTGRGWAPTIDGKATDMVTILMDDSVLGRADGRCRSTRSDQRSQAGGGRRVLERRPKRSPGSTGDPQNGIPAVQGGRSDLLLERRRHDDPDRHQGPVAEPSTSSANDPFRFNQPGAAAGSITQIIGYEMSVRPRVDVHLLRPQRLISARRV